ncbi:MAG: glycosyltransferase family 4 protein [Pirellulales bacterium]
MRRLCILTQYFPPEMGAPQARLSELGELLIDRGWQVDALTALPNYPAGRVFDGYDTKRPCLEIVGRIRTARVPLVTAKQGFVKRVASYLSFSASAGWYGPKLLERPDVLLVESPPIFIGYGARRLARRWRCPFVLNVSDLWVDSAVRMGVVGEGWKARMARGLEHKMYRQAAAVTGQSDEIIEAVRAVVPKQRTRVITNGVTVDRFGPDKVDEQARQLLGSEPGPVFLYAGLLGLAQGLDQILDTVKKLPDDVPGRVVIIGEGPLREHLEARVADERIARVRMVPSQPRDRIPALLAAADAAWIPLGLSIPGSVPSKIYEAMASQLPILMFASDEAARRVESAECGIVLAPGDLDGAAAAFSRLATEAPLRKQLGQAGRRAAETTYDRRVIAQRLDDLLCEVVAARL